ncbi:MAG TPA: aspartate aminotransferase family protein, partial [Acidimicrobiaceae bacterium]|nr:aspartate aminotransferase family protein [Acidimicrobiaceae bacterium]
MSHSQESRTVNDHQRLAELAEKHLWGHFSVLKNEVDGTRVIERGQGCYVWDTEGNRYLDGLAGLFVSQLGHGRPELAKAAGDQAATLGYFPIWTYGHPTAIELSA